MKARNLVKAEGDLLSSVPKIQKRTIVTFTAICFGAVAAMRLQMVGGEYGKMFQWDTRVTELVANLVVGIFASAAAAVILLFVQNGLAIKKLDVLCHVSDVSFLNDFLSEINRYRGKTCHGYTVSIAAKEGPEPNLIAIHLSYSYKKLWADQHLRFRIARHLPNEVRDSRIQGDAYFAHECYFELDERTLPAVLPSRYYSVGRLVINNTHALPLTRVNPDDARFIDFTADIPDSYYSSNDELAISYQVDFPLETESILAINIEVPTKEFRATFDYSAVQHVIEVYNQNFISGCRAPNDMNLSDENGIIEFRYNKWLVPKNGVIFAWWRKA